MTKEEAKKELSYIIDEMSSMECADWIEAISMGIKALAQEPCTDAISRQAVLDAFEKAQYSSDFCREHHIDYSISMEMVRIILHDLSSVAPKQTFKSITNGEYERPSDYDHCVSLDAVIDVFDTWWAHTHELDNAIEILEDKLNALPPVKPTEKVGQWTEGGFDFNYWVCSKCEYQPNNDYSKPSYNYCPNCGAKMQEVKE